MKFSDYLKFFETEDMVAKWQAMRAQAQGLGDTKQKSSADPMSLGIPNQVVDVISSGFKTGSIVPPQIVSLLKLDSQNYSLVADSTMVTAGGAYPFVKDKRAGRETGRIRFVPGFPVNRFFEMLRDLIDQRR